jgi:hypothetical protein
MTQELKIKKPDGYVFRFYKENNLTIKKSYCYNEEIQKRVKIILHNTDYPLVSMYYTFSLRIILEFNARYKK